jgi:hypothetical protein
MYKKPQFAQWHGFGIGEMDCSTAFIGKIIGK